MNIGEELALEDSKVNHSPKIHSFLAVAEASRTDEWPKENIVFG